MLPVRKAFEAITVTTDWGSRCALSHPRARARLLLLRLLCAPDAITMEKSRAQTASSPVERAAAAEMGATGAYRRLGSGLSARRFANWTPRCC